MHRRTALGLIAAPLLPRPGQAQSSGAPYKIGATIPLTGPFANTAAEYVPAAEIAVAAINQAGGVKGHPLQLLVEDSQATPQGGIAAMRKLVQVDGVQAILTLFTNVVTAQIPLADQLQIPTLSLVEAPGVLGKAEYSFAHATRSIMVTPLIREYWKQHGFKRIYAFAGNNAQGQAYASMRDVARAAGAEFDIAFVNLGDSDFRGALVRAKEFNPDGIFMNTSGSTAETTLLKEARELGLRQQFFEDSNFYSVHAWRMAAGPYAEGMIFGGTNVDLRAGRSFVRAYRDRMGFLPSYAAGEMYDIMKIFADAIARGGYTGPGIRTALTTVKGIPSTLGGTIVMGSDHYTILSGIALWQIKRGEAVKIFH
jgi:branched-chain amino acid transport system substrate-binding protein